MQGSCSWGRGANHVAHGGDGRRVERQRVIEGGRIGKLQPSGAKGDQEPKPVGQFESLMSEVLIATLSKLYPDADSALLELSREETVSGSAEPAV